MCIVYNLFLLPTKEYGFNDEKFRKEKNSLDFSDAQNLSFVLVEKRQCKKNEIPHW